MRVGVAILSVTLGVFGATLERLSLDEMTEKSTAIVRARPVSSSTTLIGSTIYTKTRFQVLERWKGPQSDTVEVVEPGGMIGGTAQRYSGVPAFTPGREVVLFLWTGPSGRTQVIGLSQGVLQVERSGAGEVEVRREATQEVLLSPATGLPVRDEAIRMPLRQLVSRMRGVLEGGRRN
jgi:hypothetical protein